VKRRLLAALAAILSAVVGTALLLSYVAGADQRAMAGMQTVPVLVAVRDVPAGTEAGSLSKLVVSKTLPAVAVAPGAVENLTELTGLVATAELKAGEQLLSSRFADPATLADAGRPKIPAGMHQVTLQLETQRVVGGDLTAGASVGVFVSVDKTTHLTLPSVLVSKVSGGAADTAADDDAQADTTAGGTVQVTLVTTAANAEKIVFGAENGTVWLSLVTPGSRADGTKVLNGKNVFK
jgi:pilus assembly protein CpaB